MALIQDGRSGTTTAAVEAKTKAQRMTDVPRGTGFALSSTSGTIAAAQAAGSCFFALRNSPTAGSYLVFIEKLRLQYTTIAAYTTSIVQGRRLSIFRGSGAATSGGTQLQPINVDSAASVSNVNTSAGGDSRIATTAGLTTTSVTWDAFPIREMSLAHLGAAGYQGNDEVVFSFCDTAPIILQPGQLLGIRNPQAMDAAGTFQISVDVAFHESVSWGSTTID